MFSFASSRWSCASKCSPEPADGRARAASAGSRGAVFEALENRRLLSGYTLAAIASFNGADGSSPLSTLVADSSGNLYGTTTEGGAGGGGTIFEIAHGSTSVTTLASFSGVSGVNVPTGNYPYAGLIIDSSGDLFGTASSGGADNDGAVFELAHAARTITTLASFNGTDGAGPTAPLLLDSSGNLYGTASAGGAHGDGTVFEIAHGSRTITALGTFNSFNGSNPVAGLSIDSSGNLFGTTSLGGVAPGPYPDGNGTVFEIARGSKSITTLAIFDGTDGQYPDGGVVLDSSGNLFGTTYNGGHDNGSDGTVFELAHGSSTITTLVSFNGANGNLPDAALVLDSSGNLFGTTDFGPGSFGKGDGTVFEIPRGTSSVNTLAAFNGTNGSSPQSALLIDSRGDLFGTSFRGGSDGIGTVFELKPVATIHAADLGGVYNGKPFPASGYVYGAGGAIIATPVFTYYLASDKTFSHPLAGAPTNPGSYVFLAAYAGSSEYLPTETSAPFSITRATATIHAADLGGVHNGNPFPATGYVAGIGGGAIATPVFTYYLASDTAFSDPLAGAPSNPGNYLFLATFAGNSDYLPTQTSAPFSISL